PCGTPHLEITPLPYTTLFRSSEIVASCARTLHKAFTALEKDGPIMEHCIEINRLENEADLIGRSAVADLFNSEKDPITLIKLKEDRKSTRLNSSHRTISYAVF